MNRVHQNVIIDGKDWGDGEVRKNSAFCNEGKWDNFIKPLLPKNPKEQTFIEYGSNAGMYLKLAKEYGFDRVIGLERSRSDVEVAKKYRGDMDYRIIHTSIRPDFDFQGLPMADVTLLANFHYHQHIDEFRQILNALETRTCYVLVVSVNQDLPHWRAQAKEEDVRHYFRFWEFIDQCEISAPDDPHPRPMYSLLFKSPKIERVPLAKIKVNDGIEREALVDFIKMSLDGKIATHENSRHYRHQERRRANKWSPGKLDEFLETKRQLILDVKNGLRTPILLDRNYRLIDGLHRFLTLQQLGYKTMIARVM